MNFVKLCRVAALALVLSTASCIVGALTFAEIDVVCPLDGEQFKTVEAMSGSPFGIFLDLKPFGAIAAPWPIAKCPTTGFVIYKPKFSAEAIAQLKPYVSSPEYQTLAGTQTNYYLAANLQRFLSEPTHVVAFTLLRATWEATPGEQYIRYASEALDAYKIAIQEEYTDQKQWVTDQLVAGELERRLGRFEAAKSRFSSLSSREELMDADLRAIVELQLKLLNEKDARPTMLPRASK